MKNLQIPQDALENPERHLWEETKCEEHDIWWEYDIVGLCGSLDNARFSRLACGCLRYFKPATPENCSSATASLELRDRTKFVADCQRYGLDVEFLRR